MHPTIGHFIPDQLYVIAVISNPARFESRYRLYRDFEQHMKESGVTLITVEACFGDRKHAVTDNNNPNHIQVVQKDEAWIKESLLNIGLSRLPKSAKYVAWIDSDVHFVNPNWAIEAIHELQHHNVVQLFQNAIDMGPNGEALSTFTSFGHAYVNGKLDLAGPYGSAQKHPGFAYAARVETLSDLGGLIDYSIVGSADHIMAYALVGRVDESLPGYVHPNYLKLAREWQTRADTHVRGNFGYCKGTLLHFHHGPKRARQYNSRWDIVKKWNYDPETDIKKDIQGLVVLTDKGLRMLNDLRAYSRSRDEDSNSVT